MRSFSLSTNYFKAGTAADEIVGKALDWGFDELELGYATTAEEGLKYRQYSSRIKIGSVHAFCPVPLSAPGGHPELYRLVDFDANTRAIARANIVASVRFAAEVGADAVVLHAGRASAARIFPWTDRTKVRTKNGLRLMEIAKAELAALVPVLEENKVVLGLENMPYLEGFPKDDEWPFLAEFAPRVKPWFDTGHWRVQECSKWVGRFLETGYAKLDFAGMHLNDVKDFSDDHFAPGGGKVDFKELKDLMLKVPHLVFEPKSHVSEEDLKKGVETIHDAIS